MDALSEKYVPVFGFENNYAVNSNGQILNLLTNKHISHRVGSGGYLIVSIRKNKNKITQYLHRVIATAFIPNPENKKTVNHKNGIKTDNRIGNLEWNTLSENSKHAHQTGLSDNSCSRNGMCKITEKEVLLIRSGEVKPKKAAELFSIDISHVYKIKKSKTWKQNIK